MMEKNLKIKLTKKILVQFLKKEKALGIMYVYGYSRCGSNIGYNIIRINNAINTIGNTFSEKVFPEELKSIIGALYAPNCLIFPIKMENTFNGLHTIYLNWCNYINKNWTEIYESYKKLNTIHKKKCYGR
jgi:hypothetical protein